jgi:hypothetical protein
MIHFLLSLLILRRKSIDLKEKEDHFNRLLSFSFRLIQSLAFGMGVKFDRREHVSRQRKEQKQMSQLHSSRRRSLF